MIPVWRQDLQASVLCLTYDFTRRAGVLTLVPETCTDMSSAVRLFEAIDPGVALIDTRPAISGFVGGTRYVREGDRWHALRTQERGDEQPTSGLVGRPVTGAGDSDAGAEDRETSSPSVKD